MGRRLKILNEYADLCSLIEKWVMHEMHKVTGSLGYPKKSAVFSLIIKGGEHQDPTGFNCKDFTDIAQVFERLCEQEHELGAAVKMHYMHWTILALQQSGYPFAPDQTYYNRLKRGHAWMYSELAMCGA
jgi:hypothetical protein